MTVLGEMWIRKFEFAAKTQFLYLISDQFVHKANDKLYKYLCSFWYETKIKIIAYPQIQIQQM